ncbi:MAG: hypothetical protein V4539_03160 [Bacteroidota bacterium]
MKKKKQPTRYCLQCMTEKIPQGSRIDKLFCSDSCRFTYHNKLKQETDPEIPRINKILKTNFDILKECLHDQKTVTRPREEMMRMGFSFDYYTQVRGEYKFCYYYGYTPKNDKYILIVKGFDEIVKKI